MAHRAQYLSDILFIGVLLAFCFSATTAEPETAYIVSAQDTSLRQKVDQLYYRDSLLTGTVYQLYETGDTAFVFHYLKGKQHGWQQKWYSNTQLAELRYYEKGHKQGTHYAWWENGNRKFQYHFVNDEHEGEMKEWFESGDKAKIFHHVQGHESGNQRSWWPDGSIRANYDVKNGKRYGLIGEKLCINTMKYAKN